MIESARTGSPWALGALYRRFQPGLRRLLAVIAPHSADDIASDVWLHVAGSLARFRGDEGAFRAWLATTARRRVIDAHRRSGSHAPRPDPASVAAMARVVAVLPPDQAEVVLMRVVDGLDVDEVARATGTRPGAVRSLQTRALRRLARQFDPGARSA
jgi:RNA polymerase sigma-70 factor (ECF subfamily)